jgi:hypothetical protein
MSSIKKIVIYSAGLLTGIGLAVATVSGAVESIIPYSFKDGDVISADTLNDLFARVKEGNQGFLSESELNGTWTCTTYDPAASSNNFQAASFSTDSTTGLQTLVQTWTFGTSGKALSIDQARLGGISNNNTGVCTGQTSFSYSTRVVESALMATGNGACTNGTGFVSPITKVSPYKFRTVIDKTLVTCSLASQPPSIPSAITATVSSGGVDISWTDNGGSPTSFVVYKKSSGTFTQVGTTTGTSYTDSSGSSGSLYRVSSVNSNGTSLKSSAAIAK